MTTEQITDRHLSVNCFATDGFRSYDRQGVALRADFAGQGLKLRAVLGGYIDPMSGNCKDRAFDPMVKRQAKIIRSFADVLSGLQSPSVQTKLGLKL